MEGNRVFYFSLEKNEGNTMDVTPNIMASWSDNWIQAKVQFEEEFNTLERNPLQIDIN
jgi:hypothetical protein